MNAKKTIWITIIIFTLLLFAAIITTRIIFFKINFFSFQKQNLFVFKNSLFDNSKVQITTNPYVYFTIEKHSNILYRLTFSQDSTTNTLEKYEVLARDSESGKIYARYTLTPSSKTSEQPAKKETEIKSYVEQVKNLTDKQFPYFNLFPYISKTIKAQYEKPLVLTIFTQGQDSSIEEKARIEIEKYLSQFNLNLEKLKEKGVIVQFREIRETDQSPLFNE